MRRAPAKPVRACILRKRCPVSHVTFEAPLRSSRFTLRTSHSTLHTPHFTLPTAHSTLHTSHNTLHTSQSTLHTSHSTLHTSQSTLHTSHSTLHTSHSTLHTALFTPHTSHCTLHTPHFVSSELFSPYPSSSLLIWLLIKIPFSRNGHSSRIKILLSRNSRELHVYLSRGPCWPTTPLMKIRSPPAKLRQRITDHFLVAF